RHALAAIFFRQVPKLAAVGVNRTAALIEFPHRVLFIESLGRQEAAMTTQQVIATQQTQVMATEQTQVLGRALLSPAVVLLFIWMIIPLAMTIYFSTLHYTLMDSENWSFVGLENFRYFLTDPAFLTSLQNTLVLVGSVLAITILLGTPLALLLDQPVGGRSVSPPVVLASVV